MFREWLIRTTNPGAYLRQGDDPDEYWHPYDYAVDTKTPVYLPDPDTCVMIVAEENPILPNDTFVGSWDDLGLMYEYDPDEFALLRPLGNTPEGEATQDLVFFHLTGWRQRVLEPILPLGRTLTSADASEGKHGFKYPSNNDPFDLEIRHKQFPNGLWGWRIEMHGETHSRSVSSRRLGVFEDDTFQNRLYRSDNFKRELSEWQEIHPGLYRDEVWAADCPEDELTTEKQTIFYSPVVGNNMEGRQTLLATEDFKRALHWRFNVNR